MGEDLTIQSLYWNQVWDIKKNAWVKADDHFINAWVTSNIPKTKGLCDHQFTHSNFFRTMSVLPPVEIKALTCDKKEEYASFCSGFGLTKELKKNCVFDLCNGMTKEQVEKIFNVNKKHHKEKPKCARGAVRSCNIFADPHVTPFVGGMYNAQVLGDWVAYGGFRLESHYRGKSFGSWVGIVQFGVVLDGHHISSTGINANRVSVDGHEVDVNSKIQVGDGHMTKSGNTITFSIDGEEVSFTSYGSYFNMAARSNVVNTRGLCNHQFVKSSYYGGSAQDGHFANIRKGKCHKKEHFRQFCKKQGLFGEQEFACMLDRCAGMKKKRMEKNSSSY